MKYYILKIFDGERGQVLRLKSNNWVFVSDSGRRTVLFIKRNTITVHLSKGNNSENPNGEFIIASPTKNYIKSSFNNRVFGFAQNFNIY